MLEFEQSRQHVGGHPLVVEAVGGYQRRRIDGERAPTVRRDRLRHGVVQPTAQVEKSNLTDDQQFFIAWAQTWRTKMREQMLRQIIVADGHAPDEFRADTVRNLDAWYPTFAVKPGQRLYLASPDRVRVW